MATQLLLHSLERSGVGAPTHYSGTLSIKSGNLSSVPVVVPAAINRIACGIVLVGAPGDSSGRVEYTLSSMEAISSGDANWRAWPSGNVLINTDDLLLGPVTALRAVCVLGALSYEFVGS